MAYRDPIGDWRSMHPDFVFFNRVGGSVRPSIVDPTASTSRTRSSSCRGSPKYAERYGDAFHRIEATVKDGEWRVLDLKRADERDAIESSHRRRARVVELPSPSSTSTLVRGADERTAQPI